MKSNNEFICSFIKGDDGNNYLGILKEHNEIGRVVLQNKDKLRLEGTCIEFAMNENRVIVGTVLPSECLVPH